MNQAFLSSVTYFLPSITLSVTAMLLILIAAYKRSHLASNVITIAGLLVALVFELKQLKMDAYQTALFTFDGLSALISSCLIFSTLIVSTLLYRWFPDTDEHSEEYFILLVLALLGAMTVTESHHFASLFLSLELMSISFIPMIAYSAKDKLALEAGIKYLVLSSTASAFMLLAIAILFAYGNSLSFADIQAHILQNATILTERHFNWIENCAVILLLAAIAFKLSLAPTHLWAADVFEGSPMPTNALLASISKASVFVVLIRLFDAPGISNHMEIMQLLSVIAAISMIAGNLLGLMQKNLLRLMAYSSIGHFGYILLAVLSLFPSTSLLSGQNDAVMLAKEAAVFAIIAYAITITGIFSVLMLLPGYRTLDDLSGLLWKKPLAAVTFIVLILSLAGIPLTIGFTGKFYLTMSAINQQMWGSLSALIIGSVIGLFYYLRMVYFIVSKCPPTAHDSSSIGFGFGSIALVVLILVITGIGLMPNLLADVIQQTLHT